MNCCHTLMAYFTGVYSEETGKPQFYISDYAKGCVPTPEFFSRMGIPYDPVQMYKIKPFQIPCGKCIGCKKDKARMWGLRCVAESLDYPDECYFITLTYDDEHYPGQLVKSDYQKFLKRARKSLGKFRYFLSGEYGGQGGRAHFHFIAFGLKLDRNQFYSPRKKGQYTLYQSKQLEKLWPYGYSSVGSLSFASAQYVANYAIKDMGLKVPEGMQKPFIIMSKGLGQNFFNHLLENKKMIGTLPSGQGGFYHCSIPRYLKRKNDIPPVYDFEDLTFYQKMKFMDFVDEDAFREYQEYLLLHPLNANL